MAALLSPVLWRLNGPDRFDMYSVGVVLLQMAFPTLRQDNTLIAFNKCVVLCWLAGGGMPRACVGQECGGGLPVCIKTAALAGGGAVGRRVVDLVDTVYCRSHVMLYRCTAPCRDLVERHNWECALLSVHTCTACLMCCCITVLPPAGTLLSGTTGT